MTHAVPTRRTAQTCVALGLSLMATLATLGGVDSLATEPHAAKVLARERQAKQRNRQ